MLKLKNISWTAPDGKQILKDVSLEVGDGRLVAITGPNGGGKTTLARIIAGIEKPDSGTIELDGQDITGLDVTERARRGVSFAFQQPVRFKGVTVRQLIEIATGQEISHARQCEILSSVGLCAMDYLDREVDATLSGGEIKRIEIATVLARHSRLSVFDEPEAGIDLWSFKNLIESFQDVHKRLSGTLIIISHQERILRIADEIVLISDGRVGGKGTGDDMINQMLAQREAAAGCYRQKELFDEQFCG